MNAWGEYVQNIVFSILIFLLALCQRTFLCEGSQRKSKDEQFIKEMIYLVIYISEHGVKPDLQTQEHVRSGDAGTMLEHNVTYSLYKFSVTKSHKEKKSTN